MTNDEAEEWVANLAFQRENNAVVSLDLQDCKAIRMVLKYLREYQARERNLHAQN